MDIIKKKFEEWTAGLDQKAARISVFEHIRDIPYAIIPAHRDPVSGPKGMLEENKGACGPKHYLLADMFKRLGIKIKYVTYTFYWNDPAIHYPAKIRSLTIKMPLTGHLACKAFIGGRWILIDATWDKRVLTAGFPVNVSWDGVSDTKCAVTAVKEKVHESLEERLAYNNAIRSSFTNEESTAYDLFIPEFNAWLEAVRNS